MLASLACRMCNPLSASYLRHHDRSCDKVEKTMKRTDFVESCSFYFHHQSLDLCTCLWAENHQKGSARQHQTEAKQSDPRAQSEGLIKNKSK